MKRISVLIGLWWLVSGCTTSLSTTVKDDAPSLGPSMPIQFMLMSCYDFVKVVQPVIRKRQGHVVLEKDVQAATYALLSASGFMTGQMFRHGYYDKAYAMYEGITLMACDKNPYMSVGQAIIHTIKTEADSFPDSDFVFTHEHFYAAAERGNFISNLRANTPPVSAECAALSGMSANSVEVLMRRKKGLPISPEAKRKDEDFSFYQVSMTATLAGLQIKSMTETNFEFDPDMDSKKHVLTNDEAVAFNKYAITQVCSSNPDNTILEAMVFTDKNI